MLKLGTKNIKNLKLGDKTIFKGIKGGKTVYRNYPIFLDYIVFDGKSCIDTGIKTLGTWNITNAVGATVSGLKFLLAVAPAGAGNWFGQTADGYWGVGANNKFDIPYTQKVDVSVTFSTTQIEATIGNTTITRQGVNVVEQNFYIGSHYRGAGLYNFVGQVGTCSYTDADGILQLDLRPAIDPCGVVCMYDMVTNKYFYNQGTGEFVAGGRFVESIVFDNSSTTKYDETSTCYINTGIQNQDGIWAEVTWKTTVQKRWLFGMGVNYNTDNFMFGHFSNANSFIGCGGISVNNKNPNNIMCADGKVHTATIKYDKYILDGAEVELSENDNTYEKFRDIYLGTTNYLNNADGRGFIGGVYNFKLYNNANELIQDLRPYVDENGVACFKDVVTDTLFYNQGTGTLTYIDFERIPYLESDGTNYIDTGLKGNSNYTYKLDVKLNQILNSSCFGMRNQAGATGGPIFTVTYSVGGYFCFYVYPREGAPAISWKIETMQIGKRYSIQLAPSKSIYMINGINTDSTKHILDFITDYNMYLFAQNLAGSVGVPQKLKAYGYTVQDENYKYVQEFIPVKRSDGVKCLYDRVENKYYELKVA